MRREYVRGLPRAAAPRARRPPVGGGSTTWAFAEALAAVDAAEGGERPVSSSSCSPHTRRGGLPRFRSGVGGGYTCGWVEDSARAAGIHSRGVAPASVRACPVGLAPGTIGPLRGALSRLRRCTCTRTEQPREDRGVPLSAARHIRPIRAALDQDRLHSEAGDGRSGMQPASRRRRMKRSGLGLPSAHGSRRYLRLPDNRGRTSVDGFLPSSASARGDQRLHRLRFERPHRSARGAARARGNRETSSGPGRRHLHGDAALLRARRCRLARPRVGRRSWWISPILRFAASRTSSRGSSPAAPRTCSWKQRDVSTPCV